jgi:hypothetical protein
MDSNTNADFAVFIMVHGRPKKLRTYRTLREQGYTGKIYLVADDLDSTLEDYQKLHGDEVLVFSKAAVAGRMDVGDNSGELRSVLFSANHTFDLAEKLGIKHFFIMNDDYYDFYYQFAGTKGKVVPKNLDKIFALMVGFYESTQAKSIAFAQTGDFIGGVLAQGKAYRFSKRKVMNTFLCSTERRFQFIGRINEDVNTYVLLGSRGDLFLTIPVIAMGQPDTQKVKGGLTGIYKDAGTYVKSFFSVMYHPSSVKVKMMNSNHKRIHHSVNWRATAPLIVSEQYKK